MQELRPRCGPHGELTAGGVADGGDALEIERSVDVGERVDSGRDVEERLGPASTCSDAPVLEIPGGEPVRGEVQCKAPS